MRVLKHNQIKHSICHASIYFSFVKMFVSGVYTRGILIYFSLFNVLNSVTLCSNIFLYICRGVPNSCADRLLGTINDCDEASLGVDFYSSRSYFHEINGNQKIQVITGEIEEILTV